MFVALLTFAVLISDPPSSWAVADIPTVITNLRNWIVGILAGLATLFLTFGGLRYLMAGGDPGEVEAAKRALKAAAIGYGLAILAPILVTTLQGIVGAGE
ncbi:pilin [Streptomyces sp. HUAS MG91]|uniref:Pilin n=1 Tax=Streptomyces tabacisoli TaxID=3156398 RepID=A0AAU8IML9_9ACTN